MDTYILHKAFYQYLRDPEPPQDWEYTSDKHRTNIRTYELRIYEMKDTFIGYYGHMLRVLTPRLQKMARWVYVPELGGTIEIKDADYDKTHKEIIKHYERCEVLYNFITEYENAILKEHELIEKEVDEKLLSEYRFKQWKNQPINAPVGKGSQLALEF